MVREAMQVNQSKETENIPQIDIGIFLNAILVLLSILLIIINNFGKVNIPIVSKIASFSLIFSLMGLLSIIIYKSVCKVIRLKKAKQLKL